MMFSCGMGIAIAYSTFRLGRRQLVSSAFTSLFGPRVDGLAGKFVTGADSASIVMGSLSTNGPMEPAKRVIVFGVCSLARSVPSCDRDGCILHRVRSPRRSVLWCAAV